MSGLPGRDSSWGKFVRYSTHQGMFHLPVVDRFLFPNDPIINEPGDVSSQTASEGGERNIIYGRVRPVGGNLIHCQKPVLRWQVSTRSGGKGHEETDEYNQHIYRTYAIGICEGPITGIIRVWRNEKLVYDARGTRWGRFNNGVFLRQYRLYLGGWDQNPDPTLESIWGAGNVPAYRGTAYIVAVNEDLTEVGGAVPQFIFEVERAQGTFLTSRPYGLEMQDDLQLNQPSPDAIYKFVDDFELSQPTITGGSLKLGLVTYDNWPAESLELSQPDLTSGTLETLPYPRYTIPEESLELSQPTITGGSLKLALISYDNWPAESLELSQPTITGGSLT